MWVHRTVWTELCKRTWEALAVKTTLEKQVEAQQGTINWMAIRLTQVEHEKAQLLLNYTGVRIETPVYKVPAIEPAVDFASTPGFTDVGDEIAQQMGISWDSNGNIVYKK